METSASLLDRLRDRPDEESWRRLDRLYRPLIHRWLQRDPVLKEEADDLAQDVMVVVCQELPPEPWPCGPGHGEAGRLPRRTGSLYVPPSGSIHALRIYGR